jgi:hypothetical protein
LDILAFIYCSLAFVQFIETLSEISVCMWFPAAQSLKSLECVMCPYSDSCSDGITSMKGDIAQVVVIGFSFQRLGFNPSSVHAGLVDRVA